MIKLLPIMSILALSSCASIKTVENFTQHKSTKTIVFELDMSYQEAFKIVSKKSRECLQVAYTGNKIRTEEHLDIDKKTGWVKLINSNAILGTQFFGYYLFSAIPSNKTKATLYLPKGAFNQHSKNDIKIKSWLEGNIKCNISRLN